MSAEVVWFMKSQSFLIVIQLLVSFSLLVLVGVPCLTKGCSLFIIQLICPNMTSMPHPFSLLYASPFLLFSHTHHTHDVCPDIYLLIQSPFFSMNFICLRQF